MLIQHLPALAQKRIILASGSPRRKELLANIGLKFEVLVSSFDEKLPKSDYAGGAAYAVATAKEKALGTYSMISAPQGTVDLLIGADTVVEHDGNILEKPDDDAHAASMLRSLSGSTHQVHTGVVLLLPGAFDVSSGSGHPLVHTFSSTTTVVFDELSDDMIAAYVASGEPRGKAGSYGIQGLAGTFVKSIHGCYYNVVGFPVHDFCAHLLALVKQGHLKI